MKKIKFKVHDSCTQTLRQHIRLTQTYLQGVFGVPGCHTKSWWNLQMKDPSGETPTQVPRWCTPKESITRDRLDANTRGSLMTELQVDNISHAGEESTLRLKS